MNLSIGDRVFLRADERRVTGFSSGGGLVRIQDAEGHEAWFERGCVCQPSVSPPTIRPVRQYEPEGVMYVDGPSNATGWTAPT